MEDTRNLLQQMHSVIRNRRRPAEEAFTPPSASTSESNPAKRAAMLILQMNLLILNRLS